MGGPGPHAAGTLFGGGPFDLDAYLARIGYTGARRATLETLRAIALRHPTAIPFESLNALLRRPIPLDPASLQQKLVRQRRGGWCYEQNLLLGQALTSLGFRVRGLAARVMWEVPAGMIRPRTHMLLTVDLGEPYLVDAGFGGLTLTGVLRVVPDVEQATPHEPFRLRRGGPDGFVMEAQVRGDWRPLYSFDEQPQAQVDYEAANWYLLNHPASHFLSTLVAARTEPDRRFALRNNELAVHHRHGPTERRTLTSAREIRRALDELFHIDVPDGPDVDAALGRVIPAAV